MNQEQADQVENLRARIEASINEQFQGAMLDPVWLEPSIRAWLLTSYGVASANVKISPDGQVLVDIPIRLSVQGQKVNIAIRLVEDPG